MPDLDCQLAAWSCKVNLSGLTTGDKTHLDSARGSVAFTDARVAEFIDTRNLIGTRHIQHLRCRLRTFRHSLDIKDVSPTNYFSDTFSLSLSASLGVSGSSLPGAPAKRSEGLRYSPSIQDAT